MSDDAFSAIIIAFAGLTALTLSWALASGDPTTVLVLIFLVTCRAQTWERPIWPLRSVACGVTPPDISVTNDYD